MGKLEINPTVWKYVSLFGKIGAENLQIPLIKIIRLHRLYIFRTINR